MRAVLSVLFLVVAVGCSDSLAPASIDGKWAQSPEVPGNSFEMDLVANGSTVTGTGTWTGEACCAGTLAVTGTINNGAVHLDITQTFLSPTAGASTFLHFDGKIVLNRLLQGKLLMRDPANLDGQQVSYVREHR